MPRMPTGAPLSHKARLMARLRGRAVMTSVVTLLRVAFEIFRHEMGKSRNCSLPHFRERATRSPQGVRPA